VPVSKTGEGQSGLRTERVTLEVTHDDNDGHIQFRNWDQMLFGEQNGVRFPGESVRVVSDEEREEFPSSCPIAGGTVVVNGEDMVTLSEFLRHTTKLTQEAGVAKRERDELRKSWLRSEESGTRLLAERNAALDAADGLRKRVAELEAASGGREQPRGWLTESERELIGKLRKNVAAIHLLHVERDANGFAEAVQQSVKTVDSLLARSTPPEVVLPCSWKTIQGELVCLHREVIAALAAAGVAVKEVGDED